MITREQVIDRIQEDDIVKSWIRENTSPGIYKILFDPDEEDPQNAVYITATFSGDNSYIPGDNRITLAFSDLRESLSNEDAGLDEDGDEILTGQTADFLRDEADRRLDRAEADGEIEFSGEVSNA